MSAELAVAVLNALNDEALDQLAELLAPRLAARLRLEPPADHWLDAKGAAAHLGITTNSLHKITAARTIPFCQDAPGGKLWFKRSELDAWRAPGRHGPA